MLGKIGITWVAFSLAAAATVWGGVFKVEIPPDLEREDVLNPNPEVGARLEALLREEISKNKAAADLGPVAFTKDGEIITRDVEREYDDEWSDNRLGFEPAGLFDDYPGSWDAALWHLREVGQPEYNGVYALAEDIYGYPFWTGEITVEWDDTVPVEGYYNITTETIYLQNWRRWWDYLNQDPTENWQFHDDAAVLTRCMLQAFHGGRQCYWDHFGSMRRAAWVAIHNELGDDGYELGFNDLYHDDQREDRPYYKCLDNYNTDELGTRLASWADPNSQIDGRIKYWRFGAANYCWWKVYRKQPQFIYRFNEQFYYYGFGILRFFYSFWQSFAEEADNGTPIEGRPFPDWFARQPILQYDHWNDDICALALDRTTARVLAYRRFIDGATGEQKEVGHGSAGVVVEKDRWNGNNLGYAGVPLNPGGYGEWDFPIHYANEGIKLTARLDLGLGPITDSRWGIDSDVAYEDDALYGVVTDAAVGGGGTVTISKPGMNPVEVPVVGKAFRWTPDSVPAPGEYELIYTPPGGLRSTSSQMVLKDAASYFSDRCYTHAVETPDYDNNGIPDGIEMALAEKFCPQVNMHMVNRLMPQTVDISLDTGWYGIRYDGGWTWFKPLPPDTMKEVIEYYGYGAAEDFISFGTDPGGVDQHEYWPYQYDRLVQEYDKPYVYYNIFKYGGKPVIQFWFYYPYNCWGNDHEGDWEHINVRISSPDPARTSLDEVVFYFHEKRKTLNRNNAWLETIDVTHPVVYVGGEHGVYDDNYDFFNHETSGGSYWRAGEFRGVAPLSDEKIIYDPGKVIQYGNFEKVWAGKCTQNPNFWWLNFRGRWGRPGAYLFDFAFIIGDGIHGPWHHECWEAYQHPDYGEYGGDSGTTSSPPLAGGADDPAPPADAEPFGPPVAANAPSPSVGDYLSPTVGDYNSPVALAPEGGGADVPGADVPGGDFPPDGGPTGLYPTNPGGDWLSTGAAAAPFERRGPLAAAASAASLACSPNPVTATATISFKLETPSRVYLAVYDLSGRRVATLAEGSYGAGDHAAYWRADVPTGIYIYRLQAGDKIAVKKVVVAR